jgi:hypothetical protein
MPSMTEAAAMTGPMTSPMILADGIRKRFGANEVLKGVSLTLAKGEVVAGDRALGLGQEHLPALPQPSGNDRRRAHRHRGRHPRRQRHRRPRALRRRRRAAPHLRAHGHGVPALQPVPPPHRAGERDRGPDHGEGPEARGHPAQGRSAAAQGRPLRQARRLPLAPVRRTEAARGDRTCAGDGARHHALRRAHLGARPRAHRRGAAHHAPARRRAHDHAGGDARDGASPARSPAGWCSWTAASSSSRAPRPEFFANPQHPRTRAFLDSML